MNTFCYELGINWASVDEGSNEAQLQVGFTKVGNPLELATPFDVRVNDVVEFKVVDFTTRVGVEQDDTVIDSVALGFEAANRNQQQQTPFADQSYETDNVGASSIDTSIYYNGNFPTFATGIAPVAISEGKFQFSAAVLAKRGPQTVSFVVDPEMEVGGGG